MARRYCDPTSVQQHGGVPYAFTWRGVTYWVRVIGVWQLATRWWDRVKWWTATIFRVLTADQQVFELYCELGTSGGQGGAWVLDVCLD